ncbi:hypothetical protein, partial [Pseudomonas syringae]|uniref:hypothetical protein n=1 Tax=Pseudomonas syringae TaxID=317 RepID=UPI0034E8EC65
GDLSRTSIRLTKKKLLCDAERHELHSQAEREERESESNLNPPDTTAPFVNKFAPTASGQHQKQICV